MRGVRYGVYPACAGIHLSAFRPRRFRNSLPRMRGDPPDNGQIGIRTWWSTPHARGST